MREVIFVLLNLERGAALGFISIAFLTSGGYFAAAEAALTSSSRRIRPLRILPGFLVGGARTPTRINAEVGASSAQLRRAGVRFTVGATILCVPWLYFNLTNAPSELFWLVLVLASGALGTMFLLWGKYLERNARNPL